MARTCFISFKTENEAHKLKIQNDFGLDIIDRSLDVPIESDDDDYIMRKIREDYLSDSTVTIHLIGHRNAEILGAHEQRFIKRELQASLYNGEGNTRSGILGVVLPEMYETVYKGSTFCSNCGGSHNLVNINDGTVVSEFAHNYYIPHDKCAHSEDDRYCVLVKWDEFILDPGKWVEEAYLKRTHPIAERVKVRP